MKDEKLNGFLKDFTFHIREEDLLPNDLKNFTKSLLENDNFKVLLVANKDPEKKLIFCKEVLIDIFIDEFEKINAILKTSYDCTIPFLSYNTKDKYVGFKFVYKDSPSSFFKKTLVKNLRSRIGKNVVVGFKKSTELK